MALHLRTFSNAAGGNSLFKALGHPAIASRARRFVDTLSDSGRIAVFDPLGATEELAQLYDLSAVQIVGVFAADESRFGDKILGTPAEPISDLLRCRPDVVFVAAFDAARYVTTLQALAPADLPIITFDELRLDGALRARHFPYLNPLNFANNFALFRDADGHHTRLETTNYWSAYGAENVVLWFCLFDEEGRELARWSEHQPDAAATVVVDSAEVRARFGLGPFTGSLFLHVVGAESHDVVKYALDAYGDRDDVLSGTHDANAWPADEYAGLPAPRDGERVLLWVQNSHPVEIPARAIGLREMGGESFERFDRAIPPFATRAIDVGSVLPKLRWPAQIEIQAGRHFVRPRYEVVRSDGARWIAHANVERADLTPDPRIAGLGPAFGRGFILPAPVLPRSDFRTVVLPTPMASEQHLLPLRITVYDASGTAVADRSLGRIKRRRPWAIELDELLPASGGRVGASRYGHFELSYDLSCGVDVDGWLHALFRYERRDGTHAAETSFGAHLYNLPVVFRDEPQSYKGPAPGLTTRLISRLGFGARRTLCHLIYPASARWLDRSSTQLTLCDALGEPVAERDLQIPIHGSWLGHFDEIFDAADLRAADGGYVSVRDTTCRLFGFHGLVSESGAFSLDHMFGC